jgi:hypothetical protein
MNNVPTPVAYFEFKGSGDQDFFVIQLVEQDKIDHVRRILSGEETARVHPQGTVVQSKADYNPTWDFHLEPTSIQFFEMNIEVCDANMNYVEAHLDEVGGAFLPRAHWCPWNSQFTREISSTVSGAS